MANCCSPDNIIFHQRVRMRIPGGEIISAATTSQRSQRKHSAIRCHKRPGHRRCPGRLQVCEREDGYIEWACPSCGDNGVISHWQGSPDDLSEMRDLKGQPSLEIVLTEEEYDELKKCLILSPEGDKIIYGATYTAEGIILRAAGEDLEDFAGYLEFNINHEEDRKCQQILHQVLDRVEAVLGTWRWSLS